MEINVQGVDSKMTTTTRNEPRVESAGRAWLPGLACLTGGLLWLAINAAQAFSVPLGSPIMGLVGTLALAGVTGGPLGLLALRAFGNGGVGWFGKISAAVTLIGMLSYLAGYSLETVLGIPVDELGMYYAAGSMLVGLGMLPLGTAAIVARRLAGWKRFAPLSVGLYHVGMVPLQIVFLDSPDGIISATLFAFWGVAWALLGYGILSEARR